MSEKIVFEGGRNGAGTVPGIEAAIDWLRASQRASLSPLDHSIPATGGGLLGYYSVAQASGATVSIGAAGHLGSMRWSDSSGKVCVPLRIRVGWTVTGAVTAATPMDLQAVIARGFTVDFTTASTAANLAAVTNTNKMRANMGASLMGTNGPRIATTAVMSGQTLTADANAFAMASFANQPSGNATVTQAIGVGHPMVTLYEIPAPGVGHPMILGLNEGILIQPVTAGVVTGSVKYYFQWEWAELAAF